MSNSAARNLLKTKAFFPSIGRFSGIDKYVIISFSLTSQNFLACKNKLVYSNATSLNLRLDDPVTQVQLDMGFDPNS